MTFNFEKILKICIISFSQLGFTIDQMMNDLRELWNTIANVDRASFV